jgi:hypothetical protein
VHIHSTLTSKSLAIFCRGTSALCSLLRCVRASRRFLHINKTSKNTLHVVISQLANRSKDKHGKSNRDKQGYNHSLSLKKSADSKCKGTPHSQQIPWSNSEHVYLLFAIIYLHAHTTFRIHLHLLKWEAAPAFL